MTNGRHEVIKFNTTGDLVVMEKINNFFEAEALYLNLIQEYLVFGVAFKSKMNLYRREQVTTFDDGTIIKLVNK